MSEPQKRIVLTFAQRGGAGKSTVTRGVLDVLRHRGFEVEGWDGDATMGQLASMYGLRDGERRYVQDQSPIRGVGLFDVRDARDRDALVNVGREASWGAVVDLPAGSHGDLEQVLPDGLEGLLSFYRERGFEPILLQTVTPFRACAQSIFEVAPSIQASGATWIVACNEFFAPQEDFVMLFGDEKHRAAGQAAKEVEEAGGRIVAWPSLRTRSYAYADAFNLPFRTAATVEPMHQRFTADVLWIRRWLQEVDTLVESFGWFDKGATNGVARVEVKA